jgi:hypothetical protein
VKGVDPQLRIGTSLCPQYHEELLKYVGRDTVDYLAASSWEASYWEARKIRWLQEITGKPWYCIGVGMDNQPTFYHTLPHARAALHDAAVTAQEMVKLCVVQDAKVIGHYTGRIANVFGHRNGDFPLVDYEGTPLPHGAIYASVGRLLANAAPAGEVPLSEGSGVAFLFRQEGRVHAVTWSGAPAGLHTHNVQTPRTGPLAVRALALRVPEGSVRVTDPFGNPWRGAKWVRTGSQRTNRWGQVVWSEWHRDLVITLSPMPVIIWNLRLAVEEFQRALKREVPELLPSRRSISFAPDPQDKHRLDLLVSYHSFWSDDSQPDEVEVGPAPGQLMTDNQWLLRERKQKITPDDWGVYKANVRLPTVLTPERLRHPLENAQVYAWLLRKGEAVDAIMDTLWIATAPRVSDASPVQIDGDLREWQARSAAWLDYSFSWARFGRWLEQVEEGGEHLSEYLSDPDFIDARLAFWCGWTEPYFYFAGRVFDDQPRKGDEIVLLFGKALQGNPHRLVIPLTEQANPYGASVRKVRDGWTVELQETWKQIGHRSSLTGFDVLYRDHDVEDGRSTTAVLRWAGASSGGHLWLVDGTTPRTNGRTTRISAARGSEGQSPGPTRLRER